MAESVGYKLYRWKNKMSYLSWALQLCYLKCNGSDLKNICICIFVPLDILCISSPAIRIAHTQPLNLSLQAIYEFYSFTAL